MSTPDAPTAPRHDRAPATPGLLTSIIQHWILVVAITILAAATSFAVSRLATPRYESVAVIHVAEPGERTVFRAANVRDRERLLTQEADRVRSLETTTRAAESLGAPWTPADVRAAVTVRSNLDTNQLAISGRAGTAVEARRLTQATLTAYEGMKLDLEREATRDAILRLERNASELETVATQAGEQLDALRLDVERQLASLPADERIRTATARLELLPEARTLQNERDGAEDAIAALRQEVRKLRIDTNLQAAGFDLVEAASLPAEPVFPQPLRDGALAAVIGFVLAVVLVWARSERDVPNIDGSRAAAALGSPVLGSVPSGHVRSADDRAAYERLAGGLLLALDGAGAKVVALTGVGDDDSSRVGLQLAAAVARDGQNAVVIDARLRGGGLTDSAAYDASTGWSDLHDDAPVGHALEVAATADDPEAQFLLSPAGSHRGASPRRFAATLARLVEQVRGPADLVLIDGPALLDAPADVSAVARGADGLVVVLGPKLLADELAELQGRIATLAVPLLGCVTVRSSGLGQRLRGRHEERTRPQRVMRADAVVDLDAATDTPIAVHAVQEGAT